MATEPFIDLHDSSFDPKEEAIRGLHLLFKRFEYNIYTLQFIGKSTTGKARSPVFTYTRNELEKAYEECLKHNLNGYDIFFMVNEGDGIIHENKRTPRSQESVITLSKLFIDTDNCPDSKVTTYLQDLGLQPHLKICSSPNRFHYYFFIEGVEKTPATLLKWQAIQKMFHRLGDFTLRSPSSLGMDTTMHDYSKVLRVPGFQHIKKSSYVTVVESNDLPVYDLEEIFIRCNAEEYLNYNQFNYGSFDPSFVPDLEATSIIAVGDRFITLQALSMHLANTMEQKEASKVYGTFIKKRLDNCDGIYCFNGNITEKSKKLFYSAYEKVSREEQAKIEVIRDGAIEVPETPETPGREEALADLEEQVLATWHLPDEFYFSAPNGFGDVIQQVAKHSMYPCPALAFGTFLTGLSILKARTHFTPHGSSPALYTLNVAPSGHGKSDPQILLQNLFHHLHISKLISNEIRSDRGIYEDLEANKGLCLYILDEVAPFLRNIQHKDAKAHYLNISKALLQLYTQGAAMGVSYGKVSGNKLKRGEKEIVIDNPMIALLGSTVPREFQNVISIESIERGLFSRFIPIVAENVLILPNETPNNQAIISSDLFTIPAFTVLEAMEQETDEDAPTGQNGSIWQKDNSRRKMVYSEAAYKFYKEFQIDFRIKQHKAAGDKEKDFVSALYARVVEQTERIATVLSQEEINLTTVEFAAKFMNSRFQSNLKFVEDNLLRGEGSDNIDKGKIIVATLKKVCKADQCSTVSSRKLYSCVRRNFKSKKHFDEVIRELEAVDSIETVPNYREPNARGKSSVGIKLV